MFGTASQLGSERPTVGHQRPVPLILDNYTKYQANKEPNAVPLIKSGERMSLGAFPRYMRKHLSDGGSVDDWDRDV